MTVIPSTNSIASHSDNDSEYNLRNHVSNSCTLISVENSDLIKKDTENYVTVVIDPTATTNRTPSGNTAEPSTAHSHDLMFDSTSSITIHYRSDSHGNHSSVGPETSLLSPVHPAGQIPEIASSAVKRSFTRQKQVKELLNTEEVYVKALKVLKEVYIHNLTANETTPLFFGSFANMVDRLLEEHNDFYAGLVSLYHEWAKSGDSTESGKLSIKSPEFETHVPKCDDSKYLQKVVDWISKHSINVQTYSSYCRLLPKVLFFVADKDVEQYRTNSIVIYNDYMVQHQDVASDYFLQQELDIRFISLIQMPTNRISRYRMIAESLLQKSKDDVEQPLVDEMKRCVETINQNCCQINNYVGVSEKIEERNQALKKLLTHSLTRHFRDIYFFENLGDLKLVGAFSTVWVQAENVRYEYFGALLFDSHLLLTRASKHRHLELKFMIPITSICNIQTADLGEKGTLFTTYPYCFKIQFEDNFKLYEVVAIFPNINEKNVWVDYLNIRLAKWKKDVEDYDYAYSYWKKRSTFVQCRREFEVFRFNILIPKELNFFKEKSRNTFSALEFNLIKFNVNHFLSSPDFDSLREIRREKSNANPSSMLQSVVPVIVVRREERIRFEKILANFWSTNEIPKTVGELTRSTSDFSLRKKLSISSLSPMSYQQQSTTSQRSPSLVRHQKSGRISVSPSMRNLTRQSDSSNSPVGITEADAKSLRSDDTASVRSLSTKRSFSFKKLIKSFSVHSNLSDYIQDN